jgi:hypothetical protein
MMVPDEPQEQEEAVEAPEIHPDQESLEVPGPPVTVAEGEAEALPEADEFKPSGEELVVSQDRTVFEVMDAHDIEQMIDSMQGRLLDVSLYDFESGGQRMVELSWKGVRECIHAMHETGKCRIGIQPETLQTQTVVDDGDTYYEAAVFAKDEYSGLGFFGFAREPKMMKRRDKPPTLDKFAKTKAINKAQRNALRMFVPEKLAQTLIAQFRKDENRIKKLRVDPRDRRAVGRDQGDGWVRGDYDAGAFLRVQDAGGGAEPGRSGGRVEVGAVPGHVGADVGDRAEEGGGRRCLTGRCS